MDNPSKPASNASTSRAEKLSILSAMLGPEALAKLRDVQPGLSGSPEIGAVEIDADRAAWHRNKLLERLRTQTTPQGAKPAADRSERQAPPAAISTFGYDSPSLDARLARISDVGTLDQEHPAIIARLVRALPREDRVEALKSLPGPVARSILRRLR